MRRLIVLIAVLCASFSACSDDTAPPKKDAVVADGVQADGGVLEASAKLEAAVTEGSAAAE